MRRWVGIFLAVVLGVGTLTSCSVPMGGVFGMMGDGTAVVQMCEGHIDGAMLYSEDPRSGEGTATVGEWTADPAVTGFSQFSLADGGNGWTLKGRLRPRDPKERYTIFGGTNDDTWMAAHLTFSQQELTKLKPGELVSLSTEEPPEEEDAPEPPSRVWTLADFKAKACEVYMP